MVFQAILGGVGAAASVAGAVGGLIGQGKQRRQEARQFQAQQATLGGARQETTQRFDPFSQEGAAARSFGNALLGLPGPATTGSAGRPDYDAYASSNRDLQYAVEAGLIQSKKQRKRFLRDNPEAAAAVKRLDPKNNLIRDFRDSGFDSIGEFYYNRFGKLRGDELPTTDPVPGRSLEEVQADARAAFDASPYAQVADEATDRAQNAFFGAAGASGTALSGRTTRSLAEVNDRLRRQALVDYTGALNGVTDRGFTADGTISDAYGRVAGQQVQASQNFANAYALGAQQRGQTLQSGINSLAGSIGFGLSGFGAAGGRQVPQVQPLGIAPLSPFAAPSAQPMNALARPLGRF